MSQYFKVLKGSETFQKIEELFARIKECNKAARELAESIGADPKAGLLTSSHYIGGGVVGFKIELTMDNQKLWRQAVRGKHYGYYFPRSGKENKDILTKIHELPKVNRSEINDVINLKSIFTSPGVNPFDDYILVKIPDSQWDGKYEPLPDMIEILGSEFEELSKEKNDPVTA